jgi:3alpha(or 20beta)-hydroxysteroid dehydrogenase
MLEQNTQEINDSVVAMTPLKRLCEPEEVARLVVFLASDESSYITWAEMAIDGGLTV